MEFVWGVVSHTCSGKPIEPGAYKKGPTSSVFCARGELSVASTSTHGRSCFPGGRGRDHLLVQSISGFDPGKATERPRPVNHTQHRVSFQVIQRHCMGGDIISKKTGCARAPGTCFTHQGPAATIDFRNPPVLQTIACEFRFLPLNEASSGNPNPVQGSIQEGGT